MEIRNKKVEGLGSLGRGKNHQISFLSLRMFVMNNVCCSMYFTPGLVSGARTLEQGPGVLGTSSSLAINSLLNLGPVSVSPFVN